MIRERNTDCILCGADEPARVAKEKTDDYVELTCPNCGAILVEGLVDDDGTGAHCPGHVPVPAFLTDHMVAPLDAWSHAEAWWTNYAVYGEINGRYVVGNKNLGELVETLREKT